MTKQELKAFVKLKREAVAALRADYLDALAQEVKKAGGTDKLARLMGRSGSYIRMERRRGLITIKNCVEEIAEKIYGIKGEG